MTDDLCPKLKFPTPSLYNIVQLSYRLHQHACIAPCMHAYALHMQQRVQTTQIPQLSEYDLSLPLPWQNGSQCRIGKAARACSCALMRMLCI